MPLISQMPASASGWKSPGTFSGLPCAVQGQEWCTRVNHCVPWMQESFLDCQWCVPPCRNAVVGPIRRPRV